MDVVGHSSNSEEFYIHLVADAENIAIELAFMGFVDGPCASVSSQDDMI